jgi:hypothetical protein
MADKRGGGDSEGSAVAPPETVSSTGEGRLSQGQETRVEAAVYEHHVAEGCSKAEEVEHDVQDTDAPAEEAAGAEAEEDTAGDGATELIGEVADTLGEQPAEAEIDEQRRASAPSEDRGEREAERSPSPVACESAPASAAQRPQSLGDPESYTEASPVGFPVFCVQGSPAHPHCFVVCGGGGAQRTGVPNGLVGFLVAARVRETKGTLCSSVMLCVEVEV